MTDDSMTAQLFLDKWREEGSLWNVDEQHDHDKYDGWDLLSSSSTSTSTTAVSSEVGGWYYDTPTTTTTIKHHPGLTVFVLFAVFCLASIVFLPCLVIWGRKFEEYQAGKQKAKQQQQQQQQQQHNEEEEGEEIVGTRPHGGIYLAQREQSSDKPTRTYSRLWQSISSLFRRRPWNKKNPKVAEAPTAAAVGAFPEARPKSPQPAVTNNTKSGDDEWSANTKDDVLLCAIRVLPTDISEGDEDDDGDDDIVPTWSPVVSPVWSNGVCSVDEEEDVIYSFPKSDDSVSSLGCEEEISSSVEHRGRLREEGGAARYRFSDIDDIVMQSDDESSQSHDPYRGGVASVASAYPFPSDLSSISGGSSMFDADTTTSLGGGGYSTTSSFLSAVFELMPKKRTRQTRKNRSTFLSPRRGAARDVMTTQCMTYGGEGEQEVDQGQSPVIEIPKDPTTSSIGPPESRKDVTRSSALFADMADGARVVKVPRPVKDEDGKGETNADSIKTCAPHRTVCFGPRAIWRISMVRDSLDEFVDLFEYDSDMRGLFRLAVHHTARGVIESVLDVIEIALISNYLGVDAVVAIGISAAFIEMAMAVGCIGGILDAMSILFRHAVGVEDHHLAGQYVQQAAVTYTIALIPCYCLLFFTTESLMLWLGLTPAIAHIGRDYTRVALVLEWFNGISGCIDEVYAATECVGGALFGVVLGAAREVVMILVTVVTLTRNPTSTAATLPFLVKLHLSVSIVCATFSILYGYRRGWLNPYFQGMFKSCALKNRHALGNLIKTAMPLSLGQLMARGEWELLTIFAAFIGSEEVAAWTFMGHVEDVLDDINQGINDSGGVLVGRLLGNGDPKEAERCAYRSVLVTVLITFLETSILLIIGEDLPKIFTSDVALQSLMIGLIPWIAVTNTSMSLGMCCWNLIGAQGRYGLATKITTCCSWLITMPLAALFTYAWKLNLEGLVIAGGVGRCINGVVFAYVFLRSDWEQISGRVQELNAIDSSSSGGSDHEAADSCSSVPARPSSLDNSMIPSSELMLQVIR